MVKVQELEEEKGIVSYELFGGDRMNKEEKEKW